MSYKRQTLVDTAEDRRQLKTKSQAATDRRVLQSQVSFSVKHISLTLALASQKNNQGLPSVIYVKGIFRLCRQAIL